MKPPKKVLRRAKILISRSNYKASGGKSQFVVVKYVINVFSVNFESAVIIWCAMPAREIARLKEAKNAAFAA